MLKYVHESAVKSDWPLTVIPSRKYDEGKDFSDGYRAVLFVDDIIM